MVNWQTVTNIHKKIMYNDRCNIYTYEDELDEDGAVKTVKKVKPLYSNVPCKVSYSLRTWDNFYHKNIDTTPYEKEPKLFIETKYAVKPGYYYSVTRYNPSTKKAIHHFEAQGGFPQVLWSHQEILLNIRGDM